MLMIYGTTGYSGGLILREVRKRGLPVIAASRSQGKIDGLETRAFPIGAPELDQVSVLLNCAGPFAKTAIPLARACLDQGVHYLDLAGEVPEHRALAALDAAAQERGVMVIPGAGFGCVPTDLAAAEASRRLGQTPSHLLIAFHAAGGASRGTLDSVLRSIHESGVRRSEGAWVTARPGAEKRVLDLGKGPRTVITNPWRADLVTASASTGAPNIDTYATFPLPARFLMASPRFTASWAGRLLVNTIIKTAPLGPSEQDLASGSTEILARATSEQGVSVEVKLSGPEAYRFTARAAATMAERALNSKLSGVLPPSRLLDFDALCAIEGVEETA